MVPARYGRTASSALIVLALASVAMLGTLAASATPAAAAGLTVAPSIAFGNVVFGVAGATSLAKSVKIANPLNGQSVTGLNVQLAGADPSEFAISNNACGSTLAPGANCTVMLTFTPAALGARSALLAVSDNANANAGSSALSGVGIAGKLTITPLTSIFGNIVVGATSAAKAITLKNPNTVALHITSASPSAGYGVTGDTCSGHDLAPAATCTITAVFSPTQTGADSGHLSLSDDAAASPQSAALSGSGILAKPTFSSPSITFGKVLVSTVSGPTTITLTNPNVIALPTGSITASAPFAVSGSTCGAQVGAGGNCQISVTFDPTFATNPVGTSQTAKLVVNDGATPGSQTVSLSGVAYGVSVSGAATQSGMDGAAITAVAVNANGSDGATLATTTADSNGNFSVVIVKPQTGSVRFRASGGSYTSEQDGATISSPSPLSALLPSLSTNRSGLELNPLTTFVDSLAQGNISRGQVLAAALSNSRTSIENDYGIATDPAAIVPQYTAGAIGTEAGRLGLILGALVNEDELGCTASPGELVTALSSDISDGIFDGMKSGSAISYCGSNLSAIAGTAQFSDALSGLQQLALAASGFTYGGIDNELTLNAVTADEVAADAATIEAGLAGATPPSVNTFAASTPVMNVGRYIAMATLLPNGKVLIAGGANSNTISSTELYDPVSNTFAVSTPVMNTARNNATATLLPNGKVLIAGGQGNASPFLSSTEMYDPVSNTFAPAPSMNTGRYLAAAALLPNGMVLIAGGQGAAGQLSSTELYDPVSNTFAAGASMNTARSVDTATLLPNGKVLIAGGFNNGAYLSSTELYDPTTNTFAAAASTPVMNAGRYYAPATLLPNGKVLFAGGANPGTLSSTELYDWVSNTFAASTPMMNTAREDSTVALLPNGKVLIVGGINLSSTELYDPVTNTFAASTPAMNTGRGASVGTLLPNGKVLIAGGVGPGSTILTSTELYTP